MNTLWQKIKDLLGSPYPIHLNQWMSIGLSGLIVFAIIYLLQPFGFYEYSGNKLVAALGYGIATMLGVWIAASVLPVLLPRWYKEQGWTVGKSLLNDLIILVLIALLNTLYETWIFHLPQSLFGLRFMGMLLAVLIVGFIPITLFAFWNRNLMLSRNLAEAQLLNQSLQDSKHDATTQAPTDEQAFTFTDGSKEQLTLPAQRLLYAEADGNYVHLAYVTEEGAFCHQMLRTTLKQVEAVVAPYTHIVRCHRTFLVNIDHVISISGNSQGYRLHLDVTGHEVPMSRSYAAFLKQQIDTRHK